MQLTEEFKEFVERRESYVRFDPTNLILRMELGDLYHQAGRLEEAASCFEHCLQLMPGHRLARGRLALVMISQRRFVEAEAYLIALLQESDLDSALLHNLGVVYFVQESWTDARRCFDLAMERGLNIPVNWAYLAKTCHHLGDMGSAIAACEQWVGAADDVESLSYLSLLLMDDGDNERGREIALQVLSKAPHDINANVVLGLSLTEHQDALAARQCFNTALRFDQNNGRAWMGLGLIHLYQQEGDDAVRALSNAVSIYPSNPGMRIALGWAKVSLNDGNGAEEVFMQCVRAHGAFAEAHGGLATSYAMQEKVELAQRSLELARRLDPNGFGAEFAASLLLSLQGQRDEASLVLNRMLERSPRAGTLSLIEQLRVHAMRTKKAPLDQVAKP